MCLCVCVCRDKFKLYLCMVDIFLFMLVVHNEQCLFVNVCEGGLSVSQNFGL